MDISYIAAAAIILIGAFTQGLTGFGFAMISVPLLSVFMEIKAAITLGALCGLIINAVLFLRFKKEFRPNEIKPLIIGAFFGIPTGALFLRDADPHLVKVILGIIILSFSLLSLSEIIKPAGISMKWGYFSGILSGILGGAFNTNGPPVLIYFYLQGWSKEKVRTMLTGYFTFTSILIVSSHAAAGLISSVILVQFLSLIPVTVLGLFAGDRIFSRISSKIYNKVILYTLTGVALVLIFN